MAMATGTPRRLLLVAATTGYQTRIYIESQKWDEDDQGFKITAPTEP